MCVYRNTLGVSENASLSDIKRKYHSLALKHHPDRGGDREAFELITKSYEWLVKHHDSKPCITTKTVSLTLEEAFYGVKFSDGDKIVSVPPGVRPGTKIKNGNNIYRIEIKKHSIFKRSNDDLLITLTIDALSIMMAGTVTFTGVDGEDITVTLSEISKSSDIISFPGKGMPNPETGIKGDLLISFIISFKQLTAKTL